MLFGIETPLLCQWAQFETVVDMQKDKDTSVLLLFIICFVAFLLTQLTGKGGPCRLFLFLIWFRNLNQKHLLKIMSTRLRGMNIIYKLFLSIIHFYIL